MMQNKSMTLFTLCMVSAHVCNSSSIRRRLPYISSSSSNPNDGCYEYVQDKSEVVLTGETFEGTPFGVGDKVTWREDKEIEVNTRVRVEGLNLKNFPHSHFPLYNNQAGVVVERAPSQNGVVHWKVRMELRRLGERVFNTTTLVKLETPGQQVQIIQKRNGMNPCRIRYQNNRGTTTTRWVSTKSLTALMYTGAIGVQTGIFGWDDRTFTLSWDKANGDQFGVLTLVRTCRKGDKKTYKWNMCSTVQLNKSGDTLTIKDLRMTATKSGKSKSVNLQLRKPKNPNKDDFLTFERIKNAFVDVSRRSI